jgi:intermediate peptidase
MRSVDAVRSLLLCMRIRTSSTMAYHEAQFQARSGSECAAWARRSAETCERLAALRRAILRAPTSGDLVLQLYDDVSDLGCAVLDPAALCRATHADAAVRDAATQCVLDIQSLFHALNADVPLYEALRAAAASPAAASWSRADAQLADAALADFRRFGIDRSDDERARLMRAKLELTDLTLQFEQLDPVFPAPRRMVARDEAVRRRAYVDALAAPTTERRLVTLERILAKRCEIARLLGARSHAEFEARSGTFGAAALPFLERTAAALRPREQSELALLGATKRRLVGRDDARVEAWDLQWLRDAASAESDEALDAQAAHYLSLRNCLRGLDLIARHVLGVALDVVTPLPGELLQRDAIKAMLRDVATNEQLGVLYFDLAHRADKLPMSATFPIRFSKRVSTYDPRAHALPPCELAHDPALAGQSTMPRVAIVMSCVDASRPTTDGSPSLTHTDFETLCHEFGHALAGLLSRTKYQHCAGTRVALAFAEVPSTLFERFAWQHSVLERFAVHHRTGKPIPADLVARLREHRSRFSGIDDQKQALIAIFDQLVHAATDADTAPRDWTTRLYWSLQQKHSHVPLPVAPDVAPLDRLRPHANHDHLVSYGCSYHAYMYSRSISAALWARDFACDPLNGVAGRAVRQELFVPAGERRPEDVIAALGLGGSDASVEKMLDKFTNAIASDR